MQENRLIFEDKSTWPNWYRGIVNHNEEAIRSEGNPLNRAAYGREPYAPYTPIPYVQAEE